MDVGSGGTFYADARAIDEAGNVGPALEDDPSVIVQSKAEAFVHYWLDYDLSIYLHADEDIAKVPTSELGSMINGDPAYGIPSRVHELAVELDKAPSWTAGVDLLVQMLQAYADGSEPNGEFSPIGMLWDCDALGLPGVLLYKTNGTFADFADLYPDAMGNIKNLIIAHLIDYCGAHPEQYGNLDLSYNPGW